MVSISTVVDPVCGMTVETSKARFKTLYKGKVYYFCSSHCLKAFEGNPEQYIKYGPKGMPKE
ncbi:MAG: YHS domain-containing protein [Sulfolobales archaeon]|nr:YHS domain-containing protein [Sulfolobales archaeon]MCX8186689.1 YHS domain-containing protein [Sulfolobales archaeon]MDW7969739.1 YHS domain-containing protein [Sulfolobales archaeon]